MFGGKTSNTRQTRLNDVFCLKLGTRAPPHCCRVLGIALLPFALLLADASNLHLPSAESIFTAGAPVSHDLFDPTPTNVTFASASTSPTAALSSPLRRLTATESPSFFYELRVPVQSSLRLQLTSAFTTPAASMHASPEVAVAPTSSTSDTVDTKDEVESTANQDSRSLASLFSSLIRKVWRSEPAAASTSSASTAPAALDIHPSSSSSSSSTSSSMPNVPLSPALQQALQQLRSTEQQVDWLAAFVKILFESSFSCC